MKRIITTVAGMLLLGLLSGQLRAQIDKGSLILSADGAVRYGINQEWNTWNGTGFAEGYVLTGSRLALGAFLGEANTGYYGHFPGLIIAPGLRYYLGRPGASNAIFIQANAGLLFDTGPGRVSGYFGKFGVGLTRQLSEGLVLDGLFGVHSYFGKEALPSQFLGLEVNLRGIIPASSTAHDAPASFQRGTLLIGHNGIRAGTKFYLGDAKFSFDLHSNLGYFLSNRFAVGGNLMVNFENDEGILTYALLPFARYYLLHDRKLLPFLHLEGGLDGRGRTSNELSFTGSDYQLSGGAGVTYLLTPKVALEGLVKFESVFSSSGDRSRRMAFELRVLTLLR